MRNNDERYYQVSANRICILIFQEHTYIAGLEYDVIIVDQSSDYNHYNIHVIIVDYLIIIIIHAHVIRVYQ